MKISKSKQELARIISENGGWREGNHAIQDKDDKCVWFMTKMKGRPSGKAFWPGCKSDKIKLDKLLPNWHQTVLSRAEYFHLYPAPDADGWIEWNGGRKSPVGDGVLVDVRLKSGTYYEAELLDDTSWSDTWGDESIVAYRLHRPEQAGATDKLSSEAVSAAKIALMSDSIEELVRKPTIEQLAADYRNAKDYADRKQQEADDAKADADAKLKALELAGEALGLLVSPITAKKEPELVITDWRNLQVGDVVELISFQGGSAKVGEIGKISKLFGNGDFHVDFPSQSGYSVAHSHIKFIRRP